MIEKFADWLAKRDAAEAGLPLDEKEKWIQDAVKRPGRCTPAPNPDCPEGSPQYNLAMRFKGKAPKGNIPHKKHKKHKKKD